VQINSLMARLLIQVKKRGLYDAKQKMKRNDFIYIYLTVCLVLPRSVEVKEKKIRGVIPNV